MRIDSNRGDKGWFVYNCETRAQIKHAVWVDDKTNRFAIGKFEHGSMYTKTFEANKIVIVRGARVALINPPDGNPEVIAIELRQMLRSTNPLMRAAQ